MIQIPSLDIKEVGRIKEVKQGIVKIEGLPTCVYGQLLQFSGSGKGMVIGFNPREVLAIVLNQDKEISVGDEVSSLGELISVPVGEHFIGRIVNGLAEPIDNRGAIAPNGFFAVFREAPGVMEREPVTESMLTGIKIIDLTIPIGKGQRELIIGDRQTGKSTIGVDTCINQKNKNVVCIYCWVGGSETALKKILHTLNAAGAFEYSIIVASPASSSAAEQYLCPYTAASLGEYFMQKGRDVLIIFDDLTKHAWIYRQISLLLERSPGREAYPGDIFYIHSQLMERAGRLKKSKGGGSMTFFPIVETLQGDITGYIQSNLISITDGQIYISTALFREGFKPAIDLGLSVSRIGSKVQSPAIKEVGSGLRLEYAQYREMLRLTKLRTRLSAEALEKMRRGEVLRELLIQPNNQPIAEAEEIVLFYAFKRKILEILPGDAFKTFIADFIKYLSESHPEILERLNKERDLSEDIKQQLDRIFVDFFTRLKSAENNPSK